jgi:hypothetical protein
MNNERYNQIIGDAYKNYLKDLNRDNVSVDDPNYILLSKEEFINKCKTDQEFSEKWGLTIKERELSLEERKKLMKEDTEFYCRNDAEIELYLAIENIPTKLITITYNDKTIESYE